MKPKKRKNKGNKQSQKGSPSMPFSEGELPNSNEKSTTAENGGHDKQDKETIQKKDQNNMTTAEKISITLNAIYVIATIGIFFITYYSLKETRKSNEAISKQFEIENTPYLSLTNVKINKFEPDEIMDFIYQISNLGKSPVKIIESGSRIMFTVYGANDAVKFFAKNPVSMFPVNNYVTNQIPTFLRPTSSPPLKIRKLEYDRANKEEGNFYFGGEITYVNLINLKKRKFFFIIQFQTITNPV